MGFKDWIQTKLSSNRVEAIAKRLRLEHRDSEIEAEIAKLNPDRLNEREREYWYHLLGIEAMHRSDFDLALQRFEEAVKLFPESHPIRFSLAQECERRGDIERAFKLFDQTTYPNIPADWALVEARLAYLWGKSDRGIGYLTPVFDEYFRLGMVSDRFLQSRGLPLFNQAWSYMVCFAWLTSDYADIQKLTSDASTRLHSYDFAPLQLFLSCLRNAEYRAYEEYLRTNIKQWLEKDLPVAYQSMQLVAFEVDSGSTEFTVLENTIKDVRVKEADAPWLEDVRTILLAKLYGKHRRMGMEGPQRQAFLKNQKMLLEPDHAVAFRLLEYQEALKQEYQRKRSGGGKVFSSMMPPPELEEIPADKNWMS